MYIIDTSGSQVDTVLYLYDSSGNRLEYNDDYNGSTTSLATHMLDYSQTYYIRLKAFGNNTGNYNVVVRPYSDDHCNTQTNATTIVGVYYEDKSISAIAYPGDTDFFVFVSAQDCVLEISGEGSSGTGGALYDNCNNILIVDNDRDNNGIFKFTAFIKADRFYYISVQNFIAYSSYTLRIKFVKDFNDKIDYYNIVNNDSLTASRIYYAWKSSKSVMDSIGQTYEMVFIPQPTVGNFQNRVILGGISQQALNQAIAAQNVDDIISLIGMVAGFLPGTTVATTVLGLGQLINTKLNKNLTYTSASASMNDYILNHLDQQYDCFIEGSSYYTYIGAGGPVPALQHNNYQNKCSVYFYGPDYIRGDFYKIQWDF